MTVEFGAEAYAALRDRVRELQEYQELQEQQIADEINWNASSLNRFMRGTIKTMPHHVACFLNELYDVYAAGIRDKKIAHAEALLASVGEVRGG